MKTQWMLVGAVLVAAILALASCSKCAGKFCPFKKNKKFAIILQSDSDRHEGLARALHALLYAKELKESGAEVTLIFDGAGTTWAEKLQEPQHKLYPLYEGLQKAGVVQVVCDFCSGAFQVKEQLKNAQLPLVSEYQGHPSIAKWANQGYQIIVL